MIVAGRKLAEYCKFKAQHDPWVMHLEVEDKDDASEIKDRRVRAIDHAINTGEIYQPILVQYELERALA